MATTEQLTKLRLFIDDPAGNNQFLEDSVLSGFIADADDDLSAAASELWKVKAARVSEWYTVNMDGNFMSRDQVFAHCMKMSESYANSGSMTNVALTTMSVDAGSQTPEY